LLYLLKLTYNFSTKFSGLKNTSTGKQNLPFLM